MTAPQSGVHVVEWLSEALGTALLLLAGGSAVVFDFGSGSPVARVLPDHGARLLLTGLLFAGSGSLIALTPFGRRSGAHLNPVVTLAFWTQRRVHPHDLLGYTVSQCAGACAGTGLLLLAWGRTARSVHVAATAPGHGVTGGGAVAIEAGMTAVLVLTLLLMTSSARTARWTPLAAWLVIAALVWQGSPYTGTSLNPARSLGPALLAPLLGPMWVYVAGPLAGALLAVGAFALMRDRTVLTAKLIHDPAYLSVLGSDLPVGAVAPRSASG